MGSFMNKCPHCGSLRNEIANSPQCVECKRDLPTSKLKLITCPHCSLKVHKKSTCSNCNKGIKYTKMSDALKGKTGKDLWIPLVSYFVGCLGLVSAISHWITHFDWITLIFLSIVAFVALVFLIETPAKA
jgi:DNA-directed RNA polymerase subunit RPC12/RpoP